MISEEFKIRISRTHIRTLILVNYYSCYMSQGSESSLCEGFDVFLRESSYHFLNVLSYVLAVLNEGANTDHLKTNDFYKCVEEYAIDTSLDDLILARIKELCAVEISSQEDINSKVRNIFLKTIANENIIDLFKIKDVMFLYDNILQQLGRNIGNEYHEYEFRSDSVRVTLNPHRTESRSFFPFPDASDSNKWPIIVRADGAVKHVRNA